MGESNYFDTLPRRGALWGGLYTTTDKNTLVFYLDVHLLYVRCVPMIPDAFLLHELDLTRRQVSLRVCL